MEWGFKKEKEKEKRGEIWKLEIFAKNTSKIILE